MRILIISGYYPPSIVGGGDISTRILAEGLAAEGAEVRVVTCAETPGSGKKNGVAIDFVQSPNVYWRYGPAKPLLKKAAWHILESYNLRSKRTIATQLQECKPDIVITSILENFGISAWQAARASRVPVIHVLRSYYLQCWRGSRFRRGHICLSPCLSCRAVSLAKKRGSGMVDGVVGISRHVLHSHLAEGYFCGVEHARIFNAVESICEQPRISLLAERPTFGFLGMLQPSKGIENLVELFSSGAVPHRLLVAGKGEEAYVADLRKRSDPARVEFIGWIEPRRLFERIDYLLFPSLWNEPFGRGIAEAMAQAIPVVAADVGGIPELIDDGVSGFLFDPRSFDQLGRLISGLADADYAALSKKALEKARGFSRECISRQFLQFIERVRKNRSEANWIS